MKTKNKIVTKIPKARILMAWGSSIYTPAQISRTLVDLHISHSVVGLATEYKRFKQHSITDLNAGQPAWPVVCQSVSDIPKIRLKKQLQVLFVCDARAALAYTNVQPMSTSLGIYLSVKQALEQSIIDMDAEWQLKSTEPQIMEYVSMASKPSFLNDIQTQIYKITPYSDRKNIQTQVILYLGGKLSFKKVKTLLKNNMKTEYLLKLITQEGAQKLKHALAEVSKGGDPTEVAETHGIDVFDINYIVFSLKKNG